ncbi:Membrane protein TerC, possibly involved in tellurium resistance [Flexibacter flexilis DSM 6793]|uniref:Membrane protein TerC, possibly involved in tellurium resistance n=1 Tax=Flexibacter flexilis DSM 6793 TaxID=927664 RepID=A0A1I1KH35_9BACT|nr:TerC family protein [Flexibacter flexilis]SFC60136.1 Membrane protein TerC, possibly involved in tellurium resistance [Flexibacter flexilis DSM 6793]
MDVLFSSAGLISLLTLTLMEIVLGIDNIIFISIVASELPENQQTKATRIGMLIALVVRVGLLFGITWIIGLTEPVFTLMEHGFSGRDIILLAGGLFLIAKTTSEIHEKLEGEEEDTSDKPKTSDALAKVIFQIVLIDIVFSFDSILTAVGLVPPEQIIIMIMAVVLSMVVMMLFAKNVSDFVNKHPSIKMLALSFLIMIGFLLVIDSFGIHVEKGYVYVAMAFSLIVELLNMQVRKRSKRPVQLRNSKIKKGFDA